MQTLHALKASDIRLKINTVVLDRLNTDDILPLSQLSKDTPIDVRFIEEMPFNGQATSPRDTRWDAARILSVLRSAYPEIHPVPSSSGSTAQIYTIPGHQGRVGIIAGFSRTFCHTCNRLRITAQGMLKTCLYDQGVCDLKALLRSGAHDAAIQNAIAQAVRQRARDGRAAYQRYRHPHSAPESMAVIGG
jgi:cyclic pyranopterin phosphate synthase